MEALMFCWRLAAQAGINCDQYPKLLPYVKKRINSSAILMLLTADSIYPSLNSDFYYYEHLAYFCISKFHVGQQNLLYGNIYIYSDNH